MGKLEPVTYAHWYNNSMNYYEGNKPLSEFILGSLHGSVEVKLAKKKMAGEIINVRGSCANVILICEYCIKLPSTHISLYNSPVIKFYKKTFFWQWLTTSKSIYKWLICE